MMTLLKKANPDLQLGRESSDVTRNGKHLGTWFFWSVLGAPDLFAMPLMTRIGIFPTYHWLSMITRKKTNL